MTSLIAAATGNQTESMKALLERGAAIEARTFEGKTALMVAAFVGHYQAAELLIKKGADVDAKDKSGNDALAYSMLTKGGEYTKQRLQELLHRSHPAEKDSE